MRRDKIDIPTRRVQAFFFQRTLEDCLSKKLTLCLIRFSPGNQNLSKMTEYNPLLWFPLRFQRKSCWPSREMVLKSHNILLPSSVKGNGPTKSIPTISRGALLSIRYNGTLFFFLGDLLSAQSLQFLE